MILVKSPRRGVHGALKFITIAHFFVEQRGGMRGVERELGFERVAIICEVIMLLWNALSENFEAVAQGFVVVLVLFDRGANFFQDLLRALFVFRGRFPQIGHVHVRTHVHMHVGHLLVRGHSRLGSGLGVLLHLAHAHSGHRGVLWRGLILLRTEWWDGLKRECSQKQNLPMVPFHFSSSLTTILSIGRSHTNAAAQQCRRSLIG